ncbi:hypothetical protein BJY01DRAFT_252660 [Aspergillus pseudoustus]|uniref:F-box domain-containing protein n=1 Tax=Aspergillus pseudoustus TaxID=1810923 RepID=A0ABR4J772_9EURO
MASADPFQHLSFDCSSNILFYLDIRSLACCERVNHGWKLFVRTWIVNWGFPIHFLRFVERKIDKDPVGVVRQFKLLAAAHYNLQFGKATRVCMFEDVREIAIAGDFVVWRSSDRRAYWQRLNLKEGGSLFRRHRLLLELQRTDKHGALLVSPAGYVLSERIVSDDAGTSHSISHIYSLLERRELYTIQQADDVAHPIGDPIHMSKKRIYFITRTRRTELRAYDICSGTLIYTTLLAEGGGLFPSITSPRITLWTFTAVIDGEPELLICLMETAIMGTIAIVNGDNGRIVQIIRMDFGAGAYITVDSIHGEFAVCIPDMIDSISVRVHKYAQGADGLFYERCEEVISPGCSPLSNLEIDVDPFRYLAASVQGDSGIPQIQTFSDGFDASSMAHHTERQGTAVIAFLPTGKRPITLPPKPQDEEEERRGFVPHHKMPDSRYGNKVKFAVRFLGGERLLFSWGTLFWGNEAFYLFHFGIQVPGIKRG